MIKPPYKIPSIAEINGLPWNGLKVASTFAGGGGSSTGYRWAGFKVIWANEFESNPQETYRANHPDTILNPRDIKTVTPEEILFATGLRRGELDLFDGSPPCQGFSIANQNRLQGKEKKYDNGISQKNEDLFFEYVRILDGLQPKVFVAENVKGLTMGKAKSILGSFEMDLFDNQDSTILHSLMNCGYVVRWQILNAADYRTPQNRQRVFFVGVRKDLNLTPSFPAKLGYQYSVLDALPWLGDTKLTIGKSSMDWKNTGQELDVNDPIQCIAADGRRSTGESQFQVKIVAGLAGDHRRRETGYDLENPIATIKRGGGTNGHQFQIGYGMGYKEKSGMGFSRNIKVNPQEPIKTIQKMQGICDGVSVAVVNGEEKRKFTMAELRRLGGFPDDYILTGSYSKQWTIIGNSVCPPQMRALAKHIKETIFDKL